MLGPLTSAENDELLRRSRVGRIGCHAEGRTYVVPIAYAYDGENVYAQSADGLKIRTMRANPEVCFEVDEIRALGDWRSVIATATYEELVGDDESRALALLRGALADVESCAATHPLRRGVDRTVVFRLRLKEVTGRFEGHAARR